MRLLDRTRLGVRGAFLLGLAEVDLVYGAGLLFPSGETRASSAYAWRQEFMPTETWGVIWMLVGVFLITQAWARRDRAAYAVAIIIKLVWVVVALGSWIAGPVSQGWQTAGLFFGFAAVTFVMSMVSEQRPSTTVTPMPDDHDDEVR
jgi:hypothetical protein